MRRRRGAQPGNHNARKNGTFSRLDPGDLAPILLQIRSLNAALSNPALPPRQVRKHLQAAWQVFDHPALRTPASFTGEIQAIQLRVKLATLIFRANTPIHVAYALSNVLRTLAQSPLTWFEEAYRDSGITRDADSFFIDPTKNAFNSSAEGASCPYQPPHLPNHLTTQLPHYLTPHFPNSPTTQLLNHPTTQLPYYSTNLTNSQWSVLAPLIPPDPHLDWLTGEPPVIIAANRWGFTRYFPTGDFQDFVILQEYHKILARFPALSVASGTVARDTGTHDPETHDSSGRDTATRGTGTRGTGTPPPGRPHTSPRLLLDAIIWKMATGHTWSELPAGFPAPRLCNSYYRRLYRSGRWYTLVLALYNHFRMESSTDLVTLVEAGTFTTTCNGKLALHPRVKPTWENCTALLFMQLARSAWSHQKRVYKQSHPHYPIFNVFKGAYPLTTGLPPGAHLPQPPSKPASRPKSSSRSSPAVASPSSHFPDKAPLEDNLAWQKLVKDFQLMKEELVRLLNTGPPGSI